MRHNKQSGFFNLYRSLQQHFAVVTFRLHGKNKYEKKSNESKNGSLLQAVPRKAAKHTSL